MEKTDFIEWLQRELDKRNWRKADLARASGISSAHITRMMKREQSPGPDTCNSIARAFKMKPETVFRQAGLLPWELEKPEDTPPTFWEWIMFYLRASKEERDQMLEMAEELAKENEEDKED